MAKVIFSAGIEAFRGKLDAMQYRQYGDKTVVSPLPSPTKKERTERQLEGQDRFTEAARYGKRILHVPELREKYERAAKQRKQPLFSVTIQDHLTPPRIELVDLSAYEGSAEDLIAVMASDDLEVAVVWVAIYDGPDLIEADAAVDLDGEWYYESVTDVAPGTRIRVVIAICDWPGNIDAAEFELDV